VAEEGEEQHRRLKVLKKIREAYKYRAAKKYDYCSLLLFSSFLLLYLILLYSQMDSSVAYGVTSTVSNAIVPQNDNTDEDQKVNSPLETLKTLQI
jgi:predicted ATP-dependent protease